MKQITVIVASLLIFGTTFAQKGKHSAGAAKSPAYFGNKAESMKSGIWGTIRDAQGEPLSDVQTMLYKVDTIMASGFSDAAGHYMTNACKEGKYMVKVVYPNTNKYLTINGVEIKKSRLMIDLKNNPPTQDTTFAYTELLPKKGKNGAKRK